MRLKEIFCRGGNPDGIKIERKSYSPSGDLPLPLALRRAEELRNRSGAKQFMGRLRRRFQL